MTTTETLNQECAQLVAVTALKAAESMPTEHRIMILHGIMELFERDSTIWFEAEGAADALALCQAHQLQLSALLEN